MYHSGGTYSIQSGAWGNVCFTRLTASGARRGGIISRQDTLEVVIPLPLVLAALIDCTVIASIAVSLY